MIAVACGLLALGVVAFLISPLLDGRSRQVGGRLDLEDLNKRKDFLYAAIRELNIDYTMGKLAQDDYQKLQAEYMQEASAVLERIEQRGNGKQNLSTQIDQMVLEIRKKRSVNESDSVQQAVVNVVAPASIAEADQLICDECGSGNEVRAKFCIECGTTLIPVVCPSCSSPNKPHAKFCADCGQKIEA